MSMGAYPSVTRAARARRRATPPPRAPSSSPDSRTRRTGSPRSTSSPRPALSPSARRSASRYAAHLRRPSPSGALGSDKPRKVKGARGLFSAQFEPREEVAVRAAT